MSFDKIEKQRVVDRICDSLKKEILDQTFSVGEKLPSESALSEQFGVSKASIKIALQRLSTLGLIETRVGQGSFVLEFDPSIYLTQIQGFILNSSNDDIAQITEYRVFLEMAAFRLAIAKATSENFERMEKLLGNMKNTLEGNELVRHVQFDYQFHLELCRATKNKIFVLTYEIIGKMIRRHSDISREKLFGETKVSQEGLEIHHRLLGALKAKDIEAGRQCYMEMFSITASDKDIFTCA